MCKKNVQKHIKCVEAHINYNATEVQASVYLTSVYSCRVM